MIIGDAFAQRMAAKLAGHYGYANYAKHGVVIPGVGIVAPEWCAKRGYGDCNDFAKIIVDALVAENEPCEVLLCNLPQDNSSVEHTMVCQGDRAIWSKHWWGYTPYDRLIAGNVGYLSIAELPFTLGIRERIPAAEFCRRHASRIAPAWAYLSKDFGLAIGPEPDGPGESTRVVQLFDFRERSSFIPALSFSKFSAIAEFSTFQGLDERGKDHVGYNYRISHVSFEEILKVDASVGISVAVSQKNVPAFVEEVRGWDPSSALVRLIVKDFDPKLAEVKITPSTNCDLLLQAIDSMAWPLYTLIANTITGGESSQAEFDRLNAEKPADM